MEEDMVEHVKVRELTLDNDTVKELAEHYGIDEEKIRFIDRRFAAIYDQRFETWQSIDLAAMEEDNDAKVRKLVTEYMEKTEQERKPLEPAEIQKLLDQEYARFTVRLPGSDSTIREVTIQELPSEAEQKFYNMFKDRLLDKASEIGSLAQATMDLGLEKKIMAFLNVFGDVYDVLPNAVVLVLNHDNRYPDITVDWVKKSMSSHRQWYIVKAQIEVNKLRDFFSELFQSGTQTMTMTSSPNAQQLQQLLAK